ncbi:MAG: glycosyltransferase [Lachnospiraceae bacterium]|nr:glycosyltransferase [Lachnospiraceae bacterium]
MSKKKPKALILASVASMIEQFNMQNIQFLLDSGYQVDVACNCKEGSTISDERIQNMIHRLAEKGVTVTHVPIPRKITNIGGIKQSLKQVKKMCDENQYNLLHCHSPIGSVVARLAAKDARKQGTKVIYTAHGFHFYKGAPKKNWILFYPIEKKCSKLTDVLLTINQEDYAFAKKRMKAGCVEYIPGIGIDTNKYQIEDLDCLAKRKELGITEKDCMLLSVGELNANKNQEVIIRAIAELENPSIHYFIAGKGDKDRYLEELAAKLNVHLHLLGYRTDIAELLNTADVYAFPSFREGLSVALMEAMAAGLPCAVSRIRGNVDLIDEKGGALFDPHKVEECKEAIERILSGDKEALGKYNQEKVKNFSEEIVLCKMDEIYKSVCL